MLSLAFVVALLGASGRAWFLLLVVFGLLYAAWAAGPADREEEDGK